MFSQQKLTCSWLKDFLIQYIDEDRGCDMALIVEIKVNDTLVERIHVQRTDVYLGANEPTQEGMWEYIVNGVYKIKHYRPDGHRELARKALRVIRQSR